MRRKENIMSLIQQILTESVMATNECYYQNCTTGEATTSYVRANEWFSMGMNIRHYRKGREDTFWKH